MSKRILSFILVLTLAAGLFAAAPLTADVYAAEADAAAVAGQSDQTGGVSLDDWSYETDEEGGSVILTQYIGEAAEVTVPGSFTIQDQSYDTVLNSATVFRANSGIRSVALGAGVSFTDGSMRLLFRECSALTSADFSAIDASGVTDMSYIFYNCTALKSFVFPSLDTSNVTTVRGMFSGCGALASVNVLALDTSSVTDLSYMFYNCSALKAADLSSFDASHVVSIRAMFSGCKRLSGLTGFEGWDTSSLENMSFAFNYVAYSVSASTQVRIDLSRWDLSHLTNNGWCFQMCRAQQIIVPDNIALMSAGFVNHAIRYAGTSYTIPAGVKKIGYAHTFYDFATDDFVEFRVAEGNTAYKTIDGVLYSADGKEMLAVPRNKPFENGVFEIAEGVDFLGELSFSRNYNIHTVILPDSYEIGYVPVYDERYIVYEDTGNLNAGTNLSIAIYCYTGVTDYAVKDTNPRYASEDGVIYSKDMTRVIAIPARYNKTITVPSGVEYWDREAMWADGSSTVDNLLANCPGVSLPASLKVISDDQLEMLNRLHTKRAGSNNPFTITLEEGSKSFRLDEDGCLIPAVSVTSQPDDVSVALGETARTSVAAEGEGLTYQWYGRDRGQTEFWTSGIKSKTYSVKLVKGKIGREVYCVITDKYGNTAKTRTAVLDVEYPEDYSAPAIVTQPENVTAELGDIASTSFTAQGDELTYQWYGRDPGQTDFWKSSIKTNTYSVKLVRSKIGREVYCVVTDKYGNTARTDAVTLNVDIPEGYELTVDSQPADCAVKKGKTARATFTVSGDGVTYQWYGKDPGDTKFWKSSIKKSSYSVTLTPAKSGRQLYCVATDKYGNSVTSDTVTFSIKD